MARTVRAAAAPLTTTLTTPLMTPFTTPLTRLLTALLTTLVAGSLLALPAGAATGTERATTINRNCSGAADASLRVSQADGERHFRLRVSQALAGSRWDVRWSYSTGQSGSGSEGSRIARRDGTWTSRFGTGDTTRHYIATVRAESVAGQVCRVKYEQ